MSLRATHQQVALRPHSNNWQVSGHDGCLTQSPVNMGKDKAIVEQARDDGGEGERVQLKQQLGLVNGVGIIVGIIVGSGIFVSPKGVLLEAGSVGLCLTVWGLTGMICCIGAICYAELGTCILTSGADYGYIMQAYGDLPAFLFLWVCLVVIVPTGNAITAMTFANYILQPLFPGCGPPERAVTLLAALCISECCLFCSQCTWVSSRNTHTGYVSQQLTVFSAD